MLPHARRERERCPPSPDHQDVLKHPQDQQMWRHFMAQPPALRRSGLIPPSPRALLSVRACALSTQRFLGM
eukprot:15451686-Alexandrium_andersonii.AAC.1